MAEVKEEYPYAAVVDTPYLGNVCSFCFTEQAYVPFPHCYKCQVLYYCSDDCLNKDREMMHKLTLNQSAIRGICKPCIGYGLYLGLSALRHSCAPTARIVFRGREAVLRCTNGGTEYSNELTIAYIEPESTTKERRRQLQNRFYFNCKCEACGNTKMDGYARSVACVSSKCTKGVCLLADNYSNLRCTDCRTVDRSITVDKANEMNDEILRLLKDLSDNTKKGGPSLTYALRVYERSAVVLSKRNVPRALLACRLIGDFNKLEKFEKSWKLVYSFHEAMRFHLPPDCPALTYYLMTAVHAVSNQTIPGLEDRKLFSKLKESVRVTHGTLQEAKSKGDKEAIYLYNTIASYAHKFRS